MTTEDQKIKRQQYLHEVLDKYLSTEPKLSLKEIAEVLVWVLGDISPILKEIKKESKK